MTEDEIKALENEITRLKRWKTEALQVIAGLQRLGKELGVRQGEQVTGYVAIHRAREAKAKAWDEGWEAARQVVDYEGSKVWAHTVFPDEANGNPYRGDA